MGGECTTTTWTGARQRRGTGGEKDREREREGARERRRAALVMGARGSAIGCFGWTNARWHGEDAV